MSRILFVVHRFYPYPGGSEAFVHWMARECVKRGHFVTVLTDVHKGDVDGIRVTDDRGVVREPQDLVIVHGADCSTQDFVHTQKLNVPVLYQVIQPSSSQKAMMGGLNADFLGCSTSADWCWASDHGWISKAVRIPHGVPTSVIGQSGFKAEYGIKGRMFMSAGGFWKHKGMKELVEAFKLASPEDATLCLFGYAKSEEAPEESENVKVFAGLESWEIRAALSEADLYIMNSSIEGFGLVLLEAMLNGVEWFSKPVGGARDIDCSAGTVYETTEQLVSLLRIFERSETRSFEARRWVLTNRLITHTVDYIEKLLEIVNAKRYV